MFTDFKPLESNENDGFVKEINNLLFNMETGISQMNNLTTENFETTEQVLKQNYLVELAKLQIKIHQVRNRENQTKIQLYHNSTQARNTFARMMYIARFDTTYVASVTNITKILDISRPAAYQMINECVAEDWVEKAPQGGYRASNTHLESVDGYFDYHFDMLNTFQFVEAFMALRGFRRCIKN